MADGFGFRLEERPVALPVIEAAPLEPVVTVAPSEAAEPMLVQAGVGAGEPESWWGELVEFTAPFAVCVGLALVAVFVSSEGFAAFIAALPT